MSEAYEVCCCSEDGHEACQGCGMSVVFADSPEEALQLGARITEEPECAVATISPHCELLRPLWEGKPLTPRHGVPEEARLWRRARWGDLYGWACLECGLKAWDEVPESQQARPDDDYPEFCLECEPEPKAGAERQGRET